MEPIRSLEDMVKTARDQKNRRVAVAAGHDPATLEAAGRAVLDGVCDITLVGEAGKIAELCGRFGLDRGLFQVEDVSDPAAAGRRAVELVRSGQAQVLMKGLIGTETYMRCILDKERGLLAPGALLTHVTVFEVATYPKLLFGGDVAIVPAPDLGQKSKILQVLAAAAQRFGIETPKAALLAASEKVSERMPATMDAALLAKMADRGQIPGVLVDGPLALDVALFPEAAATKGVRSPVAGDADILLFPNIEAGNIFYKAITGLARGRLAAVVAGASAPCVLTSRADDEECKFLSIVLGCMLG